MRPTKRTKDKDESYYERALNYFGDNQEEKKKYEDIRKQRGLNSAIDELNKYFMSFFVRLPGSISYIIMTRYFTYGDVINFCTLNEAFNRYCRKYDLVRRWVYTYGVLYAAGNNIDGQLGISDGRILTPIFMPIKALPGLSVAQIACGEAHTAILATNGNLYMMGNNSDGQLGFYNGGKSIFSPVFLTDGITKVACGYKHTAYISASRLYTFGDNLYGGLGHGNRKERYNPTLVEQLAPAVTHVSCGEEFTAAIVNGRLYMCGSNFYGELGLGIIDDPEEEEGGVTRFTLVQSITEPVVDVACGTSHLAIIVGNNRTLYTCGRNNYGQLGHPGDADDPILTAVMENVKEVVCGEFQTMYTTTKDNHLYTFGVAKFTLDNVKQVSCVGQTIGAVKNDGSLHMYGNDESGQLGDGNEAPDYAGKFIEPIHTWPQRVFNVPTIVDRVSCGKEHSVIVVKLSKLEPSLCIGCRTNTALYTLEGLPQDIRYCGEKCAKESHGWP